MIRQIRRVSCGNLWNAVEKENVVKKDIIHENSNNHNKYINNENSGEKPAEHAGAVLRAMTADDISAVEQIEQTCFSDAWSEKLLSDLLESEWDEAWVRQNRICEFPLPCRRRRAHEDRSAPGTQGPWGVKETYGPSGNLCKGKGSAGSDSGGARREHTCHKPL